MNLRYAAFAAWMVASGAAHAVGGLADVEVYDRTDRRVLPVYWHAGKAWVEGVPGHEFRVRVRNATDGDVLAVVSVDGVNVVSGETAEPGQTGYVLDRRAGMDIQGWRKSLSRTAAFYFTDVSDSYASRTARPDNVGVIGVAVFRRKAEPPPVPLAREEWGHGDPAASGRAADGAVPATAQAPAADAAGTAGRPRAEAKSSLGTGHGRSEPSHARYVDFERASPYPDEIVRLYYDRREQLVSKGVIPPMRERDPEPFPAGFAADPPHGG